MWFYDMASPYGSMYAYASPYNNFLQKEMLIFQIQRLLYEFHEDCIFQLYVEWTDTWTDFSLYTGNL